jgi:hypothetical protein
VFNRAVAPAVATAVAQAADETGVARKPHRRQDAEQSPPPGSHATLAETDKVTVPRIPEA